MKCADHPKRNAVALIRFPIYDSYFGACSECWKLHKKNQDTIEEIMFKTPFPDNCAKTKNNSLSNNR